MQALHSLPLQTVALLGYAQSRSSLFLMHPWGYGLGYAVFAQKGNIVIFGSGRLGNRVLQMLGNERENIIYFCDNDSQKWGQYIDGIEVVSPKFLQTNFDNVNYIVANKYHSEDIRKQLNLLGVSDEKICIYC